VLPLETSHRRSGVTLGETLPGTGTEVIAGPSPAARGTWAGARARRSEGASAFEPSAGTSNARWSATRRRCLSHAASLFLEDLGSEVAGEER
jgi:hypothetical protein